MFHVKDNKQGYIFDPYEYLGPKRLTGLKNSWPEIFRQEIHFQHCLLSLFANITTTKMVVRARKCIRCWAC